MHVVITDPIDRVGIDRLEAAGFTVEDATHLQGDRLDARIAAANALIVRSATTVSADRIAAASDLEVIARAGIGVDNIDIDAATTHGVAVVNAPTGGVNAVAEHTIAMAYALVRELPWTDRETRAGGWPKAEYEGSELVALTLGIVGVGRIGRAVARKAAALGVGVVGHDPHVDQAELGDLEIDLVSLEECLDRADIVTVHTPLTDGTVGLIDRAALNHLTDGYLINCARGGIVDESALVTALEDGTLSGAALDVFAREPLEADEPVTRPERLLLTPHVAGSSDQARRTIAESVADQLIAINAGDPPTHLINEPR